MNYIKNKGINAYFDNNDILIDGFKVFGIGSKKFNNLEVFLIYIGINSNIDNIKKICNKSMKKIPKGLYEYGITVE